LEEGFLVSKLEASSQALTYCIKHVHRPCFQSTVHNTVLCACTSDRLQDDGRVLLELSAVPAGAYFNQEAVRFYMPASGGNKKKKNKFGASYSTSDDDEEWMDLPRHSLA